MYSHIYSQVGIGTTTPDASAALEISSVNSGLLMPRLTTIERNAIVNPATGLLIFNVNKSCFEANLGTSSFPKWTVIGAVTMQSGSYNVGSLSTGWNYYDVAFTTPFTTVPSIQLTFREGTGINNSGSNSVTHFKVANASVTGFTIAIYDTSLTSDVFMDWTATLKTQ